MSSLPRLPQLPQLPTSPSAGFGQGGWSDYERQLDPIFDATLEREKEDRRKIQPLRKVLDLLSRGNYMSANIATHITERLQGKDDTTFSNVLDALWSGLTGEVKGTYSDYIRNTLGVGEQKVFRNAPEGKRRSQWDWADVIGFVGDIFLDPLTYVGGPTKLAKGAARQFADDTTRVVFRQLAQNPDDLARIAGSVTLEGIEGLLRKVKPGQTITDAVSKGVGAVSHSDDLARYISQLYQDTYRNALTRTAPELAEDMLARIDDVGIEGLEDIVQRITQADLYKGAGTRSLANFFGRELTSDALPQGLGLGHGWQKFANRFRKNPGTSSLRNAIWGMLNRGPLGALRQMFGFRNPYQKFLRAQELEQGRLFVQEQTIQSARRVLEPLEGLSKEQLDDVYATIATREAGEAGAPFWRQPRLGSSTDEASSIADTIEEVLDRFRREENEWAVELGAGEIAQREHYLTAVLRDRTSGVNVRRPRRYTLNEHFDNEVKRMQFVFQTDADTAADIVRSNASGLSTDLRESLLVRAQQHARMEGQVNLFRTFKEFGVNLRDSTDDLASALASSGRNYRNLGLESVDHPAFEGYLFDTEVAGILKNAIRATGAEKSAFERAVGRYMGWWKGMVTATPGFHARNFQSDTMAHYLKHGLKTFDPKLNMQSLAGVTHALHRSDPAKFLSLVDADESWLNKMLNTPVGDVDVRYMADVAQRKGVISENLMGFDAQDTITKMRRGVEREGKSLLGKLGEAVKPSNQPIRTASRAVGARVENINRFKSFLIDYQDMVRKGANHDVAIDFAAAESKKWFMDYADLTNFEQRVMKNIIPFYTFMRKNLANQLNGILSYPGMYAQLGDIERIMTYEDRDLDQNLIPDWLRQQGAVPVGRSEGGEFRFYRPDFTFQDLNMLPIMWEEGRVFPYFDFDELKQDLIMSTAPWIREVASRITGGYNFFYREQLEETSDAPYLFRLFASNPESIAFVDGFMRMIGYEEGAKLHLDENGMLKMDAQLAQTLNDFVPVLRQAEMLFYMPSAVGVPGLLETIQNATNAAPSYQGAEQALQSLSYYMGIKLKDYDMEEEGQRLLRQVYYQARDIYNEMRNTGGLRPTQIDYRRRTDQSIRRLSGN